MVQIWCVPSQAVTSFMITSKFSFWEILLESYYRRECLMVQVRPVAWLSVILYPVGRVVTAMSTSLLKLLGLKSSG